MKHDKKKWWAYKDVFEERIDQAKIFFDTTRRKIIIAGRRWGKSVLLAETCIKVAITTDRGSCWIVGPVFSMTKQFWYPLKERLKFLGYNIYGDKNRPKDCKVDNANLSIELLNVHGTWSTITLKSADKESTLVGAGLDFLGIDEFRYIKKNVWEEQLLPTLIDYEGSLMVISTITNKTPALWSLYEVGDETNTKRHVPGWRSWKFDTTDNPYVDDKEVADLKNIMSKKYFLQEFYGKLDDDKLLYSLYDPVKHNRDLEIDYSLPIRLSFDFNYSFQTCSVWQIVGANPKYLEVKADVEKYKRENPDDVDGINSLKKIVKEFNGKEQDRVVHVLKNIVSTNCWIETHCENILRWLDNMNWTGPLIFYGDYTGKYKTSVSNTNNWALIRNAFREFKTNYLLNPNPVGEDRYETFQKKLLNSYDEVGIYFNSKINSDGELDTQPVIDDMLQLAKDENGYFDSEKWQRMSPELTHNSDNMGYGLFREFGRKKIIPIVLNTNFSFAR